MAKATRPPRPRGTAIYGKPALNIEDLLARYLDRGLEVPATQTARVERYLRQIGYYRLSPYTIPFQLQHSGHQFKAGTRFDDLLDLYVFDRTLRLLVLDALERAEVAVRAALTDHMSTTYGDPHWYTDAAHFQRTDRHANLLKMVKKSCDDLLTDQPERNAGPLHFPSALDHYLTTYGKPELPPSWVMVETLTIGQLNNLYGNLTLRADRTAIANILGLNDVLLRSWLTTYVRVRNICAHHGRLWNVGLGVYPAIPQHPRIAWLASPLPGRSRKRLYPVLVSLQSILNTISPNSTWAQRLFDLLQGRPDMNLNGMGIPQNWHADAFWDPHLTNVA